MLSQRMKAYLRPTLLNNIELGSMRSQQHRCTHHILRGAVFVFLEKLSQQSGVIGGDPSRHIES